MALNSLKKIIKYRSTYSGTKETDILYEKYFISNLNSFHENELSLLKSLFDVYSDAEIYDILTNKSKPMSKFKKLFEKISNI
ncbi:MAG: succinate dehydrogenase assembly factor 2 [Pelagibacteraceae bacterium]|jgi:succinate dehydrogenase flavin-adding protein (antitoxin of CptAB toxin-antitoxin module)|nr:succinate dehydrogenase assembly factor 2 [Pelagibacteraceae bacterium]MBT3901572.1 succinate dehydrogenase assembly factor 2 [Pelagibacteraceae bacterium]MBT4646272.1 succinate dehydrogenase assembly factor 2 [Pelagibacteraceae bacterium]MBT4952276.1 succinate dehydrogenase assembly factor 2 [Pelagibacteraceae bacterium]MBT6355047.1 succinate dehydrogenase assembly factor 2 [Pelagibacteraceae bacterium]